MPDDARSLSTEARSGADHEAERPRNEFRTVIGFCVAIAISIPVWGLIGLGLYYLYRLTR
jgi:hypothetical protein